MWTASLPLGASAYEKRGVAVTVPAWDETKCIQCNNCAYVCPHATIRPFALTEEEAAKAPAAAKIVPVKAGKGKGVYSYTMAVSPLDCMGCGVCVGVCPTICHHHGSSGEPAAAAGRVQLHGILCGREEGHPGQHRQGQPVPSAHAGVLRLLRRLCRDQLCPPGDPALRRPDVHLQRHRLFLHLGRPRRYLPLLHQPGRPRPRMVQLSV